MKIASITIVLFSGILASHDCRGETDAAFNHSGALFALPVLYYTTDTGLGYGAAGLYGYQSAPGRESQALFSAVHTTKRQFQSVVRLEHYLSEGNGRFNAEIQYNRFPKTFFGLGNRTTNDNPSAYTPEYTEGKGTLDRNVWRDINFRIGAFFRNQALVKRGESNPVQSPALPWGTGRFDSGMIGGILWDSRDNTSAANRGSLLKLEYTASLFVSEGENFNRFSLDIRSFHQPLPGWISGTMLRAEGTRGDYPFYFLPALGGQERLRGFESDRFMDRNAFLVQQDLRFPILWRIGGCVFVSSGQVSHDAGGIFSGKWHISGGGGLRYFIKRQAGMLIRADIAFGNDSRGTYITFGEAF